MSETHQVDAVGTPAKKPFVSLTTILILALFVAVVVVMVIELRARSAYNGSREAILDAFDNGVDIGGRTTFLDKDVTDLLEGAPIRDLDGKAEEIRWRGVMQTYAITLRYGVGGEVMKIETGSAEEES